MTSRPPALPPSMQDFRNESKLDTLSVLHYVMSGLSLIMVIFVILHGLIMITVFSSFSSISGASVASEIAVGISVEQPAVAKQEMDDITGIDLLEDPPVIDQIDTEKDLLSIAPRSPVPEPQKPDIPKVILPIMYLFYSIFGLAAVAMTVCNFLSARYLKHREKRLFCQVIAAINCLHFPFGTALGVFSLVVLTGPEMESRFAADTKEI